VRRRDRGGGAFSTGSRKDKPREDALKISFKGYSNSPSGERFALFAVANLDTCKLVIWNGGGVEFLGTN